MKIGIYIVLAICITLLVLLFMWLGYQLGRSATRSEKLLYAKDAIFRLIGQYYSVLEFDGKLYIYHYCMSALERAFSILEIEEDCVELPDFCQMWEDNNRAIWQLNNPDEPYDGITADMHYDCFIENYNNQLEDLEYENT